MFAGNFAPAGWAFCNGQLVAISQNDALFSLIGTTYGGDGQNTFALPDLRGRIPIHQGLGFNLAQNGGVEMVTLTTAQLPSHTHPGGCSTNDGNNASPANAIPGVNTTALAYVPVASPQANMNAGAIGNTGGSQPHDNMQPYLCVSFIISLFGIFPSPT